MHSHLPAVRLPERVRNRKYCGESPGQPAQMNCTPGTTDPKWLRTALQTPLLESASPGRLFPSVVGGKHYSRKPRADWWNHEHPSVCWGEKGLRPATLNGQKQCYWLREFFHDNIFHFFKWLYFQKLLGLGYNHFYDPWYAIYYLFLKRL